MTTIRPATIDDITHVIALGRLEHAESRWRHLSFDDDKVGGFLCTCLHDDDNLFLVAEAGHGIIGGFLGHIYQPWYSHDKLAGDYTVFIHPQHRGCATACRLIKSYVEWAFLKGVRGIEMGIISGVNIDDTAQLYEYLGFKKIGYFFEYVGER